MLFKSPTGDHKSNRTRVGKHWNDARWSPEHRRWNRPAATKQSTATKGRVFHGDPDAPAAIEGCVSLQCDPTAIEGCALSNERCTAIGRRDPNQQ
jgi:hypothetical protein